MKANIPFILLVCFLLLACSQSSRKQNDNGNDAESGATQTNVLKYPGEKHFTEIRQITFGGDNAEAYYNSSGDMMVCQITNPAWDIDCDQIFLIDPKETYDDKRPIMISTGYGRTTCSYFMPGDTTVIYASTHLDDSLCPPKPEKRTDGKYVWPVYAGYDLFICDLQGNIITQLTDEPGYDAEATLSPNGDKIVFTSTRSGDLELWTMNVDGSDLKQITSDLGYDGGAFFSPDGTKLIFRASRPKTDEEVQVYKDLLSQGLVMPINMELFICNADGSDLRQLTDLGGANWAPFFFPGGRRVIFSSNHASEKGYPFNLYAIDTDGTHLEQITHDGVFDAFPMFSPDGRKLIFSSNRNNNGTHDTNLFLADWED